MLLWVCVNDIHEQMYTCIVGLLCIVADQSGRCVHPVNEIINTNPQEGWIDQWYKELHRT